MSDPASPAESAQLTVKQATALLTRYSRLAGDLAAIEADRSAQLAPINAAADKKSNPVLARMVPIAAQLEAWWKTAAAEMTGGKRKSIALGGCIIGSRTNAAKLTYSGGDDDEALAALRACKWAKPYVRVSYSIERAATLKALDGDHGKKLVEIGFGKDQTEQFILAAVDQAGTRASTA